MTRALRSSGRHSTSEPLLARPIGVRPVATITASGMMENSLSGPARVLPEAESRLPAGGTGRSARPRSTARRGRLAGFAYGGGAARPKP